MILQQLYKDADAIMAQTGQGEPFPSMYNPKRVRWEIRVRTDANGDIIFFSFMPLEIEGQKGAKGLTRIVPDCKVTSGVRPRLLVDKTSYVTGLNLPNAQGKMETKVAEKHEEFKALVRQCAAVTGSKAVRAVADFLDKWDIDKMPPDVREKVRNDDVFEFVVDGERPVTEDKVKQFWAAHGRDEPEPLDDSSSVSQITPRTQCLVSGKYGPVENMMPVSVKGIPGGQSSGMEIVSINAPAFESYGLKAGQSSPISRDAGERFGKALNALIASERHRQRAADVTYVFWSRAGVVNLPAFTPPADTGLLRKFIHAALKGDRWTEADLPNNSRFHIFGLSPNAARVVVRSALDTTIGELGIAQANWFTRLEIVGTNGLPSDPLPLYRFASAAYRDRKDVVPGVEDALVRAALNGDPLPQSLLQAVVIRCRLDTEYRVNHPRAALLKYILTQNWPLEEALIMTEEVTSNTKTEMPTAYHCGRLFAELEDIQRAAIGNKINTTISDRFFGSASTAPASVFGTLLAGASDHMGKLRRNQPGTFNSAEQRLEAILVSIEQFPRTLTLEHQAYFSLGYYHHKAQKRKDIAAYKAGKGQPEALSVDNGGSLDAADTTTTGEEI